LTCAEQTLIGVIACIRVGGLERCEAQQVRE
jgi:hypothetical protein